MGWGKKGIFDNISLEAFKIFFEAFKIYDIFCNIFVRVLKYSCLVTCKHKGWLMGWGKEGIFVKYCPPCDSPPE